jgi:hypothetical protein
MKDKIIDAIGMAVMVLAAYGLMLLGVGMGWN